MNKTYVLFIGLFFLSLLSNPDVMAKTVRETDDCSWGDISFLGEPKCSLFEDLHTLVDTYIECNVTLKNNEEIYFDDILIKPWLITKIRKLDSNEYVTSHEDRISKSYLTTTGKTWIEGTSIYLGEEGTWEVRWDIACRKGHELTTINRNWKTIFVEPPEVYYNIKTATENLQLLKQQMEREDVRTWMIMGATLLGAVIGLVPSFISSYILQRREHKIKEIRKCLEKVYGPLYSILVISNNRAKTVINQDTFLFEPNELDRVYKIFVEYAYLIPRKLRKTWVNKVIKKDRFFTIKYTIEKGGVITVNLHDLFDIVKEEYDKWNLQYKKMKTPLIKRLFSYKPSFFKSN